MAGAAADGADAAAATAARQTGERGRGPPRPLNPHQAALRSGVGRGCQAADARAPATGSTTIASRRTREFGLPFLRGRRDWLRLMRRRQEEVAFHDCLGDVDELAAVVL